MRNFIIIIGVVGLLIGPTTLIFGQREGDQWVIGYWSNGSPEYSMMFMDFSSGNLALSWDLELRFKMSETQSSICNSIGEPLIWTNGMQIMGTAGQMIADTISYKHNTVYWDYFYFEDQDIPFGFPEHGGAIILPLPESPSEYVVVSHSDGIYTDGFFQVNRFLESRVVMNKDTSFSLLYQDSVIASPYQWYTAPICATRHANGRDWWLVTFEADGPGYASFLLDPRGIVLQYVGEVDTLIREGIGQTAFSNAGNYLARMDATTLEDGQFLVLYSFDRCTGEVQRIETFHMNLGVFTGVAFSPSERYLYGDENKRLYQWDLWADDIAASQTLVDTFDGFVQPGWFEMQFGPMMLAPDGRIYIVPPAGSSEFMHVIDRPDMPATECNFLQHHINLTVPNGRSAPNIPNYRLGPVDGSPCDTLGLDNHPQSRWRYETEDVDPLEIRFTDLSFFRPEVWHWDFGDGEISSTVHPIHTYPSPGLYYACLTVSNEYSADTSCQWIEIESVSTDDTQKEEIFIVHPNPFSDYIEITPPDRGFNYRTLHVTIIDIHGRIIASPEMTCPCRLKLGSIPDGVYFYTIKEGGRNVGSGKIIKSGQR